MATTWIDGTSNSTDSWLYRIGHIAKVDDNLETDLETLHGTKANTSTREYEDELFRQIVDISSNKGDGEFAMLRKRFARFAHDLTIHLADQNLTTLKAKDFRSAMEGITSVIRADGRGFNYTAPTIGTVTAAAGNTGDCNFVLYARDGDANSIFGAYTETIEIECTDDRFSAPGTVVSGAELFTVSGQAWSPPWSRDWPNGSGVKTMLRLANAKRRGLNPGENITTNGNFEGAFTSGIPANWTAMVGDGDDFAEGATVLRGTKSLQITGDGTQNIRLRQRYGAGLDSLNPPIARSPYLLSGYFKNDGSVAAGALALRVTDGTNALSVTPYDDGDSAVAASVTVDVTADLSSWTFQSIAFSTPAAIPAIVQTELFASTAITTSEALFVDEVVLQRMHKLYGQGLSIAGCAGATDPVPGDKWTVAITQNNASSTLIYWLWRLFAEQWKTIGLRERDDRMPVTLPLGNDGADTSYTDASYLKVGA